MTLVRVLAGTAVAAAAVAAVPAAAGGFYLQEQSPRAVGRAFAGEAAIADSAATVFYNPAGMTNLPGVNLDLGTHVLCVEFAPAGPRQHALGRGQPGQFPDRRRQRRQPVRPADPDPLGLSVGADRGFAPVARPRRQRAVRGQGGL